LTILSSAKSGPLNKIVHPLDGEHPSRKIKSVLL